MCKLLFGSVCISFSTQMSWLVYLVLFLAVYQIKGDQNCDKQGNFIYEDLGCKPKKEKPDDPCPSSYDCGHLYENGSHCYFNGYKYDEGEAIHAELALLSCNAGCRCTKGKFRCSNFECIEWKRGPEVIDGKGCLRLHKLNECCTSAALCPPFDNVPTCEVDGVIYREGQKFYPNDSCSVCVCKEGYSGKYEDPYCRPISCAIELEYTKELEDHCAPVYAKKEVLCCPEFWNCWSESDVINPAEKPSNRDDICLYGNKTLKIGETVDKIVKVSWWATKQVKCECQVPPLLTCRTEP